MASDLVGKQRSSDKRAVRLLIAIVLVHAVLGTLYSVVVPLWESYDENGHYAYVHYLRNHRRLPAPDEPVGEMGWQLKQQPPLYYALAALTTFWFKSDESAAAGERWEPVTNPWFGDATTGGYNLFIHTDEETFPYRGVALVVHVLRLLSVLLSTVTVILVYFTARVMFPKERGIALAAAALIAFAPQFLFLGSVVTNDIAVAMFSSAALFFLVYALVRGARWNVMLGFWSAWLLAMLSKITAIYLAPLAALALLLPLAELPLKRLPGVRALLASVAASLGAAAVAMFALRRMWGFFGVPGGEVARAIRSILSGLPDSLRPFVRSLDLFRPGSELWYWFQTFWASFGWGNIGVAKWIYWALLALCLLGALGCLVALVRQQQQTGTKLAICVLAASVALMILVPAFPYRLGGSLFIPYGRYSLPAMPAVCILLATGLAHLVPERLRSPMLTAVATALLGFAVWVPFGYIMPAYARPTLLQEGQVQAIPNRVEVNFDGSIELLGWELEEDRTTPGSELQATLYWRALVKTPENYVLALKVVGADGRVYGQVHTYPGRGNYPTSLWKQGEVIRDSYRLSISPELPGQTMARLSVGFLRWPSLEPLPAFSTQGGALGGEVLFGGIKVAGKPLGPNEQIVLVGVPASYSLGDEIALVGYALRTPSVRPGDPLELRLYWQARQRVEKDYSVFVHVVNQSGVIVVQQDNPPRQGTYPTGLWDKGETVVDQYQLVMPSNAPAGSYEIRIGMYLLGPQERLPVFDAAGIRQEGDYVRLARFSVP